MTPAAQLAGPAQAVAGREEGVEAEAGHLREEGGEESRRGRVGEGGEIQRRQRWRGEEDGADQHSQEGETEPPLAHVAVGGVASADVLV